MYSDFFEPSMLSESENILKQFDYAGQFGICKFVGLFKNLDLINNQNDTVVYSEIEKRKPLIDETIMLLIYLNHKNFNMQSLKTRIYDKTFNKYDCVFFAITSFVIKWDDESLNEFGRKYHFEYLMQLIVDELKKPIYQININDEKVYYIPTTLKIFSKYFNYKLGNIQNESLFNLYSLNLKQWEIDYFVVFIRKLFANEFTKQDIFKIENMHERSGRLDSNIEKCNIKYVTGSACVGKTSLLNKLKLKSWKILSRSDIGTFSGKAKCAASIAALHQSISYVLSKRDVIGDRGSIDNPLWSFMMSAMNKKKEDLLHELIRFFESSFNENAINQYKAEKVIVIVDLDGESNRNRMYSRAIDGDIQRAHIEMYPYIQTISYLFAAHIFGWPVFCTPYENGIFAPERYNVIELYIDQEFGQPINENNEYVSSKPTNGFDDGDYLFAKKYGIYK